MRGVDWRRKVSDAADHFEVQQQRQQQQHQLLLLLL